MPCGLCKGRVGYALNAEFPHIQRDIQHHVSFRRMDIGRAWNCKIFKTDLHVGLTGMRYEMDRQEGDEETG